QMLTPDVLAFLPPSMQVEDKAASEWIAERNTESIVLAAQDRQTNTLLGLLILTEFMKPYTIEVRLGYLFAKQHWGKGYATELLHGLIDWCNQTNRPMKLLGGVVKDNKPSAKVLEKAGFGIDHTLSSPTTFFYRKDLHSH
ncbi:MAG: GNAT family N-acetyltransferase, partial [Kordiimonas sp.]